MGERCIGCLRTFLLVFNFFLLIVGLGLLGLGTYIYVEPEMQSYLQATGRFGFFTYFTFGIIGIGGITMVAALIGCCGSYHENECLLGTYFTFLFFSFSIHLSFAILFHLKMDLSLSHMHSEMQLGIARAKIGQLQFMDVIEKKFECCGVVGPVDYHVKNVPISCCDHRFSCDKLIIKEYNGKGCETIFRDFLYTHFNYLCLISASIAAFEMFALLCSLIMCCTVRKDYSGYNGVDQTAIGYYDHL